MKNSAILLLISFLLVNGCIPYTATKSVYDYGCKPSILDNIKGMRAYFADNDVIEIPPGVFAVNGDLVLKGKKKLIINGTLKGVKGTERIITDGDVEIRGSGGTIRFGIEVQGGSLLLENITMKNCVRTAVVLINNDDKTVDNFVVRNVEISNSAYGILRQGARGEKPVTKALIDKCYIHDCRGDGIEWNVGNRDGEIIISNNVIRNINSDMRGPVSKEWGIGIGVAGARYRDDFANCVKNFKIIGNTIEEVRHAIHIESGCDFEIKGNRIVTSSKVSLQSRGTLSLVGIVTYGCTDFSIEGNEVIAMEGKAISNEFASLPKVWWLASPTNYSVKDNTVVGSVTNWCAGENNKVEVTNNNIRGTLRNYGAATHIISGNNIVTRNSEKALIVDFYKAKDNRSDYNAKTNSVLLDSKNKTVDSAGKLSKSIVNKDKIKVYKTKE